MSLVWFCADTHIGHKNIPKFRPMFDTMEEHDEYMLEMIHETVNYKRNILYILGDVAFTEDSLKKLSSVNTNKNIRIILGNHDTERGIGISDWVNAGFTDIHGMMKYKNFWLSHAPIHDSELRGKYNVYGHCHNAVIEDPRYRCVSMEQIDYKPISLETLQREFGGINEN